MKLKTYLPRIVSAFVALLCSFGRPSDQPARPAGAPPKILNMLHAEIQPGKENAYPDLEAGIVRGYNRENIPPIARRTALKEAEGEAIQQRLEEIARAAHETTESQLFAVDPAMSHMPKAFAAGDPAFWSTKASLPPTREARKDRKPSTQKR